MIFRHWYTNRTTPSRVRLRSGFEYGGEAYLYARDHLGSNRGTYDVDGEELADRFDYDPYGRRTWLGGTGETEHHEFGFTGHYFHAKSGLYLAPYRAYDPETGRWVSRDPIGEDGGINIYAYVDGNPINFRDPDGQDAIAVILPSRPGNPQSVRHAIICYARPDGGYACYQLMPGEGGPICDSSWFRKIPKWKRGVASRENVNDPFTKWPGSDFVGIPGSPEADKRGIDWGDARVARQDRNYYFPFEQCQTFAREGVSTYIRDRSYWLRMGDVCFPGDTLVWTPNGYLPIRNLQVGDQVYAYNLNSGAIEISQVTNTHVALSSDVYAVFYADTTVHATGSHPFYVLNIGWKKVQNFEPSDTLFSQKRGKVEVHSIRSTENTEEVFNITVNGNHNYFVTTDNLLVHNK